MRGRPHGNGYHLTVGELAGSIGKRLTLLGLPVDQGVEKIITDNKYFNEFESLILAVHRGRGYEVCWLAPQNSASVAYYALINIGLGQPLSITHVTIQFPHASLN